MDFCSGLIKCLATGSTGLEFCFVASADVTDDFCTCMTSLNVQLEGDVDN